MTGASRMGPMEQEQDPVDGQGHVWLWNQNGPTSNELCCQKLVRIPQTCVWQSWDLGPMFCFLLAPCVLEENRCLAE